MPKLTHPFPKYSKHTTRSAFVKIDGRQIWLGRYDDDESRGAYDRINAE